jgi:hypothetical protein
MLFNSERFQKDYRYYQSKIREVTNERVRKELSELLSKLIREVKDIDNQHEQMLVNRQLRANVDENRMRLVDIRKQLDRKIKDWDQIKNSPNL